MVGILVRPKNLKGKIMKLKIVQIGNSLGIRIPQSLLKQCNFKKEVTVTIIDGNLILGAIDEPRKGWDDAFKKMALTGDDKLLDDQAIESSFDQGDWEW